MFNSDQKIIGRLGLGTAAIGRPLYINLKTEDTAAFSDLENFKNQGLELLRLAKELGIQHFDTSSGYGMAEELLIRFLKENPSDHIGVSTKWGYTYVANFNPKAQQHEMKEHSLDNLNRQWEESKLLLPHLKVYQIHSVTPDSNVLEDLPILQRLHEIKKEHGIEIGLSTSGAHQAELLEKALEIKVENEPLFGSFQVTFNLLDQSLVKLKNKLGNKTLIIKEALANGRIMRNNAFPHYGKMYSALEALASKYKVGTDAIALRFCMDSFENAMVLSGAGTKKQLLENVKALAVKLESDDIDYLKSFGVDIEAFWNERKNMVWN